MRSITVDTRYGVGRRASTKSKDKKSVGKRDRCTDNYAIARINGFRPIPNHFFDYDDDVYVDQMWGKPGIMIADQTIDICHLPFLHD